MSPRWPFPTSTWARALGLSTALALVLGAVTLAQAEETEAFVEFEDGHTGEVVRLPRSVYEAGLRTDTDDEPVGGETGTPDAVERPPGAARPNQQPRKWARGTTRCSRYGRLRYCDGPLRVPEPFGPEAQRARKLGLGTHAAAGRALDREPHESWLAEVARYRRANRLQWPVDGGHVVRGLLPARRTRVTVGSGRRRRVQVQVKPPHRGVDIGARPGTYALGIDHGLVVYAGNELRGYGNVVIVLHSSGTVSLYSHLRAAWVFAGQHVARGQIVGEVGETGLARGPHLHFEWRRNGRPLDPLPRFVNRPNGRRLAPPVVGEVLSPDELSLGTEDEFVDESFEDPDAPSLDAVDAEDDAGDDDSL